MADKESRTEEATPRKKEKLREEGNVAKSTDVGTAAMLLSMAITFSYAGADMAEAVVSTSESLFRLSDASNVYRGLARAVSCIWIVGIPAFVVMIVTFAVGIAQTRVFTLAPLAFKWDRLNPIPNLKRVVPSKETFGELLKQVLKLGAIGSVAYVVIADATPRFMVLPAAELPVAGVSIAETLRRLVVEVGLAFVLVAVVDYLLAVRKFNEEAKMSKDEVKDERKQDDASPEVKQRLRRRMMELAQGGPAAVKDATVVITNPTHYAVALRYRADKDDAPMVLAKGVDSVALEMRGEARRHQVPIMENRSLARALYAQAKVGKPIPLEFYRAVAEVIAFVMHLHIGRTVVTKEGS